MGRRHFSLTPRTIVVAAIVASFCIGCADQHAPAVRRQVATPRGSVSGSRVESPTSDASLLEGTVVAVTDGDTITVLVNERPVKVRLEGIDCPEIGQPFGSAAKKRASSLCFATDARVRVTGEDRYGRTLGEVFVGDTNLNQALVRDGFAWHFKKYSSDETLAKLETNARTAGVGLWADANPIAPWDWRDLSADERVAKVAGTLPSEDEPGVPPTTLVPAASGGSYWITTSSGVRHNRGCRYYESSRGRHCGPTEGRACKICGG